MQISENGIAFIKANEGFVGTIGNDVGHPVIGYGHDIQGDIPQAWAENGITPEGADALLRADLSARYEPTVNAVIDPSCTQNQFDALCDFAYNLGTAALRMMVAHGWSEIVTEIPYWNHVGGQVNDGLTKRRAAEVVLFTTPS